MRNRIVVLNAAAMSALTMVLTDLLPIDRFIHPMPPVLSGTPWLAIHVPIIMVGYSVLALGVVVAHMQIGIAVFAPHARTLVREDERAALLVHARRVDPAPRRDPDRIDLGRLVVGALLGLGPEGGLVARRVPGLHGDPARAGRPGASAPSASRPSSIVAFQTILMTYLGVNYVLAAGLHSYGFGDSSVVRSMIAVAVLETAFVAVAWTRSRMPAPRRGLRPRPAPAPSPPRRCPRGRSPGRGPTGTPRARRRGPASAPSRPPPLQHQASGP